MTVAAASRPDGLLSGRPPTGQQEPEATALAPAPRPRPKLARDARPAAVERGLEGRAATRKRRPEPDGPAGRRREVAPRLTHPDGEEGTGFDPRQANRSDSPPAPRVAR